MSLFRLDNSDYVLATSRCRKQIDDAAERLHDYDANQVAEMESVERDLTIMKQYINNKSRRFTKLVASYSIRQLSSVASYDKPLSGLTKIEMYLNTDGSIATAPLYKR